MAAIKRRAYARETAWRIHRKNKRRQLVMAGGEMQASMAAAHHISGIDVAAAA